MIKFLLPIALIALIVWFFLRGRKKDNKEALEDMVKCAQCGTYVSLNDAVIVGGKYFCGKECLESGKGSKK